MIGRSFRCSQSQYNIQEEFTLQLGVEQCLEHWEGADENLNLLCFHLRCRLQLQQENYYNLVYGEWIYQNLFIHPFQPLTAVYIFKIQN